MLFLCVLPISFGAMDLVKPFQTPLSSSPHRRAKCPSINLVFEQQIPIKRSLTLKDLTACRLSPFCYILKPETGNVQIPWCSTGSMILSLIAGHIQAAVLHKDLDEKTRLETAMTGIFVAEVRGHYFIFQEVLDIFRSQYHFKPVALKQTQDFHVFNVLLY